MRIYISILLFFVLIFGCSENKKHKITKVHTYKTKSTSDDSWIYWYLIYSDNKNDCYSYSSPTPISNFSRINFGSAGPKPQNLEDEKEFEEVEIDDENLPSEVEGVETSESESSGESSSGGDDGGSSGGGDGGGDGGGGGD